MSSVAAVRREAARLRHWALKSHPKQGGFNLGARAARACVVAVRRATALPISPKRQPNASLILLPRSC